jgi:predicted HD phosphohydrolase
MKTEVLGEQTKTMDILQTHLHLTENISNRYNCNGQIRYFTKSDPRLRRRRDAQTNSQIEKLTVSYKIIWSLDSAILQGTKATAHRFT